MIYFILFILNKNNFVKCKIEKKYEARENSILSTDLVDHRSN